MTASGPTTGPMALWLAQRSHRCKLQHYLHLGRKMHRLGHWATHLCAHTFSKVSRQFHLKTSANRDGDERVLFHVEKQGGFICVHDVAEAYCLAMADVRVRLPLDALATVTNRRSLRTLCPKVGRQF